MSILDDLGPACQAFSWILLLALVGHATRSLAAQCVEVGFDEFQDGLLGHGLRHGSVQSPLYLCEAAFSHKQLVAARWTSAEHKTRRDETTILAQTFASMILAC